MDLKDQNKYFEFAKTFIDKVPFNQVLGLELKKFSSELCEVGFAMKPELIGNYYQKILHGGVIAATLDAVSGSMAAIGLLEKAVDPNDKEFAAKIKNLGTIDMRIDYLQPGKGEYFTASARLLRVGKKIAVTRSELHNENREIIALGTASFLVG
jgi:uncharacterized protein (TIGR00369 family)